MTCNAPCIQPRFTLAVRRRAVRAFGCISVAATSVIVACRSELSVGGSLAVEVAGLGASPVAVDGGRVAVAASGGPAASFEGAVDSGGTWIRALPDGDYVVTYAPPVGYALASGETGTRRTHVSVDGISRVTFTVTVDSGAIGAIVLSVAGLIQRCGPDGGYAVLRRTDLTQRSQTVAIPMTGKNAVTVVAGTYTVGYLPPSGYQTSGTTRIGGVEVAARSEAAVAFGVRAIAASLYIEADIAGPPWPPDGGNVTMLRTDTTGQVPYSFPVPLYPTEGYYAGLSLTPGVYVVTYTPPTGLQLVTHAVSAVASLALCPADAASLAFAAAPSAPPNVGSKGPWQ